MTCKMTCTMWHFLKRQTNEYNSYRILRKHTFFLSSRTLLGQDTRVSFTHYATVNCTNNRVIYQHNISTDLETKMITLQTIPYSKHICTTYLYNIYWEQVPWVWGYTPISPPPPFSLIVPCTTLRVDLPINLFYSLNMSAKYESWLQQAHGQPQSFLKSWTSLCIIFHIGTWVVYLSRFLT